MTRQPAPLPADRLARRREHLMVETAASPHRLSRRVKAVLGGVLVAAAVGGGTVAVAGTPGVFRQDNGVVAIDGNALDAWYQGKVIDFDQIEDLSDDGKAMYSTNSIELACHGVVAYFDTEAEVDAYSAGYNVRVKAVAEKRAAFAPGTDPADTDVCAWWKDPIPGVPGV